MTKERTAIVKNGSWGVVIGAVVAMVIGFTWGGWVTANTADKMSDEAVLASHSAICVAQFMMAPDYEAQLKVFKDTESWKRREVIEKGGYDKMPGEENARGYVSNACVDGIEVVLEK